LAPGSTKRTLLMTVLDSLQTMCCI
jgi:hypothetical protein